MLFWLKKFVSFWLMPLPFCLTLLAIGLCVLLWSRRARLGRGLLFAGTILLMLFSNKFVSDALVRPLETRYPAIPEFVAGAPLPPELAACRFVVVLGSGNGNAPGLSATNQLSVSGLARLTEAVRLLRVLPDARAIISGPGDLHQPERPTHTAIVLRAAESLGFDPPPSHAHRKCHRHGGGIARRKAPRGHRTLRSYHLRVAPAAHDGLVSARRPHASPVPRRL